MATKGYNFGGSSPLEKGPAPKRARHAGTRGLGRSRLHPVARIGLYAGGAVFGLGSVATVGFLVFAFIYVQGLKPSLPDEQQLANYEPAVTTRVHAGDGSLLAEFARERRLFVPVQSIPDTVKQAFLSAEDKNFYKHSGLDYRGIMRAALKFIPDKLAGNSLEGGSTITQQVAKNFLLTSDQRFDRKVKEALIARRMERAFTKDHILELYLNEIYLGNRSYGVAAAALNYFNKSLQELTPAEAAYLATLAKAPNNYHPVRQEARATERRNWILNRMREDGFLTAEQLAIEQASPLGAEVAPELGARIAEGQYFAEEVRRLVGDEYGSEALYDGGLSIRTTLDPVLQAAAQKAFRTHLIAYDRRHGWRGALGRLDLPTDLTAREETAEAGIAEPYLLWQRQLLTAEIELSEARKHAADLAPWQLAVVLSAGAREASIGLTDGTTGTVPLGEVTWARAYGGPDSRGPEIKAVSDVISAGDLIHVERIADTSTFRLQQVPAANGGFMAMDPHTGRVLAMVGGFSFGLSEFNRSTQAWRQPGSTFKPFVYAAALDNGYTPSSIVLDAPFVAPSLGDQWWKPGNYEEGRFYGESTLRLGIEKSRNTMTARLAQEIGIGLIIDYAKRFGVSDNLPRELAISLGAGETTLQRMTGAYAMFVNGGRKIEPILIDRIQNRYGETIYAVDQRACFDCDAIDWSGQAEPRIADEREQIIDPRTAFQMVSILEGVIDRGTGAGILRQLDPSLPLAGKTGTTDEYRDAWFVGFSPDLAAGVYIGFDTPATLGQGEGGAVAAAPVFGEFMAQVLPGREVVPFRTPSGVRLVRVNPKTGRPAGAGEAGVILEAFKAEDDLSGSNRFSTDPNAVGAGKGDEGIADDLGGVY